MIVVSGASGQLGRRTIEYLRERTDAARVVALSRTPDRIADLGVATRRADFDDPDGLLAALDGAERLLLISTDAVGVPGRRIIQHTHAIQAAAKAGVGHVIYTSFVRTTDPGNPAFVASDHAGTEHALVESGLTYTMLRENVYTDQQLTSVPGAVASGVLASNEGDGRVAYVTRDDIAAVAAAVLAEGGYEGQRLDLTGPAAVTRAEIATILSEVTGVPVRYQPLTDDEFVAGMVEHAGLPEPAARAYATFGEAARGGWLREVTGVVARVAGRQQTSVADFLAAHRDILLGYARPVGSAGSDGRQS
jgi:NAD(P)H dehydrogenase (quinone)